MHMHVYVHEWLCLLHYNIGVPEQALGWLPLGLGLGWLLKINPLNFHVHIHVYDMALVCLTSCDECHDNDRN